jgi:quinolinate synthase
MAMNAVQGVLACLERGTGEIQVPEPVRSRAAGCIERMLDFVKAHPAALAIPQRGAPSGLTPDLGAA